MKNVFKLLLNLPRYSFCDFNNAFFFIQYNHNKVSVGAMNELVGAFLLVTRWRDIVIFWCLFWL